MDYAYNLPRICCCSCYHCWISTFLCKFFCSCLCSFATATFPRPPFPPLFTCWTQIVVVFVYFIILSYGNFEFEEVKFKYIQGTWKTVFFGMSISCVWVSYVRQYVTYFLEQKLQHILNNCNLYVRNFVIHHPSISSRYLVGLALHVYHWDSFSHSFGVQRLLLLGHNI